MSLVDVEIRLPADLVQSARALATAQDVTLGQLVRTALDQEIRRSKPKPRNCADEALVARLQRLLAADMAAATSWEDLAQALQRRGFSLRPAGGGLTLHDHTGQRLCKSSELGFGYARLVKRFNAPMPGHPHRMPHLLSGPSKTEEPDDFDVIEPF